MSLSSLLKSAAGTCRYCGNKAGLITRDHPGCRAAHQSGWNRMVQLAVEAARPHALEEKNLWLSLAEIAKDSYGAGTPPTRHSKRNGKRE